MKKITYFLAALAANGLVVGAFGAANAPSARPDAPDAALHAVSGDSMLKHIKKLASDDFEGRFPGSKGEERSVAYIQKEFIKLGLAPGNPDGSYVQKVPLVGVAPTPTLTLDTDGKSTQLHFTEDFTAWSPLVQKEVTLDKSNMVFVGYGVIAPEYGWDDYKGMDMHGKTLVMLINDPAIPDPNDPSKLDPKMFKGDEMTYYGRWTYKYEIAAKLGAAAAIIVHETKPAAYPWEVVRHSWGQGQFEMDTGANSSFPSIASWMHLDRAKDLFRANGLDFDALKKAALSKDFKPIPLTTTASFKVENTWNKVQSKNVLAKIEGSDPTLKNETIIYSAHWDHFGIVPTLPGPRTKKIFHGALDNASGVATLLELAKAYKALPVPPKRTILFIATTAEEQGLLGARYYVQHPLYPLEQTLVDINIDGINPWGRTKDLRIVGFGKSNADEIVAHAAAQQTRTTMPDDRPELGGFFRADQFEFAKGGVPGIYLKAGANYIGKPAGYGKERIDDYIAHHYHSVDDIVNPAWNLSGAVEDTQLLFMVGYDIAQGSSYPQWHADSEFHRSPASNPVTSGATAAAN